MEIPEIQKSGNAKIVCVCNVCMVVHRQTVMTMSVSGMHEYVCMYACIYPGMHDAMHVRLYVDMYVYIGRHA